MKDSKRTASPWSGAHPGSGMREAAWLGGCSDAIIVGAGLSGLATSAALKAKGISHSILEKEGAVAAAWRRRHPQLRLNTHRWLSRLQGMDYPPGASSFPHRDEVVSYLTGYAQMQASPIEFETEVLSVARQGQQWLIQTTRGARLCRNVIFATGRDQVPWVPPWRGLARYRGRLLHAADFGEASCYAGCSVLVIGAGNSAIDTLNHLACAGTGALWLSVRNPPTLLPKHVGRIPLQPTTILLRRLPVSGQNLALRLTQWLFYRDLPHSGFALPPRGGATRLHREGVVPAIDDGFADALRTGRITVLPQPEIFDERGVRFVDGTRVQPDVVIAATGYRPALHDLVGHLGVLGPDGLPRVPCGAPDAAHPGLWFVGMRPDPAGYFQVARDAASKIARRIRQSSGG